MSNFFKKNSSLVNEGGNDSNTNLNNGGLEQKEFEQTIQDEPTNKQYEGNFDSLLEHFSNDVQEVK